MPIGAAAAYAVGVTKWSLAVLIAGVLACDDPRRPGGTGPGGTNSRRDAAEGADASPTADAAPAEDASLTADAAPPNVDAAVFADAFTGSFDARPAPDAMTFLPDAAAAPDAAALPPDAGAPVAATIADIRSGAIPFGANVTLFDVVVTALHDEAARPDTLYVQDPRGGSSNAGIKVFVRTGAAFRDERIDVSGIVTDYFGEAEINGAQITNRGTSTTLSATPMTVAEAMNESHEGMLVQLVDITRSTVPYSCFSDDPLCTDTRLWEVNGPGGIIVYDFMYTDFEWDFRQGLSNVTGVMGWRYGRRRIMPRTDQDLPN